MFMVLWVTTNSRVEDLAILAVSEGITSCRVVLANPEKWTGLGKFLRLWVQRPAGHTGGHHVFASYLSPSLRDEGSWARGVSSPGLEEEGTGRGGGEADEVSSEGRKL